MKIISDRPLQSEHAGMLEAIEHGTIFVFSLVRNHYRNRSTNA